MNFFIIPFLMILIIIEFTTAYKWKADDVPNPFTQPGPYCNLIEQGYPFCDVDRLLDEKQVNYIIDKQKKISMMGKCPCSVSCKEGESGLVIGFVIAKEIATSNEKLDSMDANSYALQEFSDHIRKKWQLGTCDNSILITIATGPKQYGLSIGEKAGSILNETWIISIIEESFRDRNTFYAHTKINNILYMLKEAINEELKKSETASYGSVASLTDSNNNNTILIISITCFVVIILIIFLIGFIFLRHRKENDDVSLRDVWTKKFWSKTGNQYKEAKQSENVNEKDLEKNEDEEVKAKLASTEDLKPVDDIENVDDKIQYPKLSKV